ncbi:MAG: DMT family transporter [Pseudomonadota bacterium]|nr:DMT family transporter [Pseudomonadota bacterium]
MKPSAIETRAKLACAYAGLVWGLFWLPLRALEKAGVEGLWAIVAFYLSPLIVVVPLLAWRLPQLRAGGADLQFKGIMVAIGMVPYSVSLLYTDVVRAILLFYLTPIWSALLARLVLGEAITPVRWVSMGLGFLGLIVILRSDGALPLPDNAGDWLAFAAGILWAAAAVSLRRGRAHDALDLTIVNFLWSAVLAVLFLYLFRGMGSPAPSVTTVFSTLPWLVPTLLVVLLTGTYATMWATPKLNPAVVGLLFMTEISVGAITAALWADERFGSRELAGVVLITGAGVLESVWELWFKPRPRRA